MAKPKAPLTIADLGAWTRNPRTITAAARDGLCQSLQRFGDLAGIVWNRRNNSLVCGHQRVSILRQLGAEVVEGPGGSLAVHNPQTGERWPVRVVDWSDDDHAVAAVVANNTGIQGEWTSEVADVLRDVANAGDIDLDGLRLDGLMAEIERASVSTASGGDALELAPSDKSFDDESDDDWRLPGVQALRDDVIFEANVTPHGFPPFRPDRMFEASVEELATTRQWCGAESARIDPQPAWWLVDAATSHYRECPADRRVASFYTDDHRFEALYAQPSRQVEKMLAIGTQYAVAPNFSVGWNYPLAVKIFQLYRSRWMSRYMQEAGIRVMPDVFAGITAHDNMPDALRYEGIPAGLSVISCQCNTACRNRKQRVPIWAQAVAKVSHDIKPAVILVVGEVSREVVSGASGKSWAGCRLVAVLSRMGERRALGLL